MCKSIVVPQLGIIYFDVFSKHMWKTRDHLAMGSQQLRHMSIFLWPIHECSAVIRPLLYEYTAINTTLFGYVSTQC